jgi:hypothetical protein
MYALTYRLYDFALYWGYGHFLHDHKPFGVSIPTPYDHTEDHTCAAPAYPIAAPSFKNWDGKLSLAKPADKEDSWFHFLGKSKPDITVDDCAGTPISPGDLVKNLCFSSSVDEQNVKDWEFEQRHYILQGNARALWLNLVVPTASVSRTGQFYTRFKAQVTADGQTILDSTIDADDDRSTLTDESRGGKLKLPWTWRDTDAFFRCPDTTHVFHAHEHWCWFKHEY